MIQTTFVELSTGEMFLYDQSKENVDFLAAQDRILVEPKSTYKVVSRMDPRTGDVSYGFLRMDNDAFPPLGKVSIARDKVMLTYDLDFNSEVGRVFEQAKTQESAKKAGLALVK